VQFEFEVAQDFISPLGVGLLTLPAPELAQLGDKQHLLVLRVTPDQVGFEESQDAGHEGHTHRHLEREFLGGRGGESGVVDVRLQDAEH